MVPQFPLPALRRYRWETEEKRRYQVLDQEQTDAFRDRELAVWAVLWRSPQACAWAAEPWRHETVAEFARIKTLVEQEPDASAALIAQMHRYRDQIGLTPAGLRENGWAIAADEVTPRRESKTPVKRAPQQRRLRVAGDGGS